MVTGIATLATNLKQQELGLAVGTKLMKTAMDSVDANAENLHKLMEQSAKTLELAVQPHLGANLDLMG